MKIIITGASEGLGYQTAKLALEKGYQVVGISRKKPDLEIEHISADLTKLEDLRKVVAEIKEKYSDFSAFVNCVGRLLVQELGKIDYEESLNLLQLNVLAPVYLLSELIDLIKANEADIVNIGSTVGTKAYESQAVYGASKWAVRGLNHNLQLELKNTKCRVIGFNPGGFKSRIFEKATGVEVKDWSAWMKPEELAKLILHTLELPKNMEVSEIIINRK